MKKISIIVTNYNGQKLLKKNLEEVYSKSSIASEIIVADDASTDDSLKFLTEFKKTHPKLVIISHKKNFGFAKNSNHAVKVAKGELVVLLNSDIKPTPNYIENSLYHFNNQSIFGVGFCEIGNENWAKIFWSGGYFQYEPGTNIKKPHITGWLSGGSSIIVKKYFLKLGGFDPVYEPFYSEDVDLGFRAWKSGYKLIWEPSCKIYHKHEATTSKFNKRFTDYVKERNRLLVVKRNITDPLYLLENRLVSISRVLFGPNYIKIIRAANRQINKHPPAKVLNKLTDRQVFNKFL